MTERRAFPRNTRAERPVNKKLDRLKAKLIQKEIRCEELEKQVELLQGIIWTMELRYRIAFPAREKASA